MRAGASEEESPNRAAILRRTGEGAEGEHLRGPHFQVHHVAAIEPQFPLQPERMLEQTADDLVGRAGSVAFELLQDRISHFVGDIIPGGPAGQVVWVILGPEPEDLSAGRGEGVVHCAEGHRHEGRIARGFAPQVVAVRGEHLLTVAGDELQTDAGGIPGMGGISHGLAQSQAQDGSEPVAHLHLARGGNVRLIARPQLVEVDAARLLVFLGHAVARYRLDERLVFPDSPDVVVDI